MKLAYRLAGALLTAACVTLPSGATAEEVTFIVHSVKDAKAQYGSTTTIWTANCGKELDVKLAKQQVACTLEQNTCEPCTSGDVKYCRSQPKVCQFVLQSTDQPPTALTFGISTHNPTCYWAWDPYAWRYIYRCF